MVVVAVAARAITEAAGCSVSVAGLTDFWHVRAAGAVDQHHAWEVVGSRTAATHDFPTLPPAIKLHVYGPLDLLLALAGLVPKVTNMNKAKLLLSPSA